LGASVDSAGGSSGALVALSGVGWAPVQEASIRMISNALRRVRNFCFIEF
jgi:hypothetical protein